MSSPSTCEETRACADALYRWMTDELTDHEGRDFLPANVACDYAGMRHFINGMAERFINRACLDYAARINKTPS